MFFADAFFAKLIFFINFKVIVASIDNVQVNKTIENKEPTYYNAPPKRTEGGVLLLA